jgi:hypothetical protein
MDYRGCGVWMLLGHGRHDRAYYYCAHCGHGWFPTDEEMHIAHKQTPGCCEVVSLTGVVEPYAEAAEKLLHKLTGLNLSASTVQVTTERVGDDVATRRAAGETLGPATPWNWHRDANGKRVAYTSLDATAVLQQGLHAEKAESRMPWVGSVFNPVPMHERKKKTSHEHASHEHASHEHAACATHRVWPTRYVCGVMSLDEIGQQLRAECVAVGIGSADVVLGLTDGGNGLETCLVETVLAGVARETVLILDFFHATEHLREFVKLWQPDESARREQLTRWCHTLKHQGGTHLLTELEALDLTARSDVSLEAHRKLVNYIRNNQHRMDYPTYLSNGWEIGSGEIESACKNVINHRLGGAGMRWRPFGTTAVCQLRALYRSEFSLWQHYWLRTTPT